MITFSIWVLQIIYWLSMSARPSWVGLPWCFYRPFLWFIKNVIGIFVSHNLGPFVLSGALFEIDIIHLRVQNLLRSWSLIVKGRLIRLFINWPWFIVWLSGIFHDAWRLWVIFLLKRDLLPLFGVISWDHLLWR